MSGLIKLLPLFFMILFISCSEEDDCVGCNLNPKIKIQFEPVAAKKETDSLLKSVNANITVLADSLSGTLSGAQKSAVESELKKLREDSIFLNEEYALFRSNKIKIAEISAPGAVGLEQFQDSVIQNFALPINMTSDTTTFYISYHGFFDTLQLFYQRGVFKNLEGMRMQIKHIDVVEEVSTFDSIRVKCNNRECSNDQTTVHVYF